MTRDLIGMVLILSGVLSIVLAIIGVFRFHYVLNRMHASAMVDTLGVLLILAGLMVLVGISAAFFKYMAIIVFMWMASPVMSHLIARAEVLTHAHIADECEVISHDNDI